MSVWDERAQAEEINGQDLHVMLSLGKGPRVDTIPHAQGPFGYSKSNPIPVDDQLGQLEYLACLRCQCKEPFDFHRVGNVGIGPDGHMVDKYELACKKSKHGHVLYLDMYHEGQSGLVPEGMGWGKPKGEGVPFYVASFPNGLADAFEEEMKMSAVPGAVGMMTRPFAESVTCMHCKHEQDFIDQLSEKNSLRGKYLHVDRNYAVDCLEEITGGKKKKSSEGLFARVTSWFRRS